MDIYRTIDINRLEGENRETHEPFSMSDFDKLVNHEDFHKVVLLAAKVKALRSTLNKESAPSTTQIQQGIKEFTSAIQMRLASSTFVVERNLYPTTDSLIDESIQILEAELKKCLELKILSHSSKKSTHDPIAVKYSKRQTDILTQWMIDHRKHPFPNSKEIEELGKLTDLSYSQVVNWTTNVRKRNLRATVHGGKKPHHFLDFLFLAEHRDKQKQCNGNNQVIPTLKTIPKSKAKRRKKASTKPSVSKKVKLMHQHQQNHTPTNADKLVTVTPPKAIPDYNADLFSNFLPGPVSTCPSSNPFSFPNNPYLTGYPLAFNLNNVNSTAPTAPSQSEQRHEILEFNPTSIEHLPIESIEPIEIDESSLLKEEIVTPREGDAAWFTDALLDPSFDISVDENVQESLTGNKRPSFTFECIDNTLSLKSMDVADFDDLLNSSMEDLEDADTEMTIPICSL